MVDIDLLLLGVVSMRLLGLLLEVSSMRLQALLLEVVIIGPNLEELRGRREWVVGLGHDVLLE
jgi:hypothetical protein